MGLITDLHVTFISLVKRPATGKSVILRADDQRATCFAVRKMDAALQRVYGIVYAPGEVDSQGDTADAAVIRRAATRFLREYNQSNVDVEHSFSTELAVVAESWLVRSGDPLFPEEPDGAWAVGIQIYDPELWARLEAGELTGLSLAGMARYENSGQEIVASEQQNRSTPLTASPSSLATSHYSLPTWLERWLRLSAPPLPSLPPLEPPEETPMNEDQIKALLKSEIPALVAATLAAQKSAEQADAEAQAKAAELAALKTAVAELTEQVKQALHKGAGESGAGGGETLATSLFD